MSPVIQVLAFLSSLLFARAAESAVRPLVIWHGLGDTYNSPGILQFIKEIKSIHEGIFVHSIYIDEDSKEDQRAGWFGNATEQVNLVAEQLACIPELEHGFDAIGFSQGGQFLRAYVEYYNSPPIHNLITYGSQHMGVSDLPGCAISDPIWCSLARSAARLGVYSSWAQGNLIQAQYYRDVDRLDSYFASNTFLTGINAEIDVSSNETAKLKENLSSLSNFVMVLFTQDTTVVPKESAWFGSYAIPEQDLAPMMSSIHRAVRFPWWPFPRHPDAGGRTIISMREQPLYKADTIGIRTLDESGRLHFESCDAVHMHLKVECWEHIVRQYVGGAITQNDQKPSPLLVQNYY